MKKQYWPLCADVFTFSDKLKIAKFLFTERIWTYGIHIRKYEEMWERYLGYDVHAIMVSSGSTANELIALRRKWELQQAGEWPRKNKVIFPVNTWISSVSPWLNMGFEAVFMDVQPHNLNSSSMDIAKAFAKTEPNTIGTVFYTALLGYFGDLEECKKVTTDNGAKFLMDNCEASFSRITIQDGFDEHKLPLCAFATCSTSIFYSHFTTSGTEGGLIFTRSEEERDWFRMARSHGMTRGMPEKYKNPNVNPDFDFYMLGSNYRSSNLQAYMASLDFYRGLEFSLDRQNIMAQFELSVFKYGGKGSKIKHFHNGLTRGITVPLALPIIAVDETMKNKIEGYMKGSGIATRPIVGGCLLHHTAFKGYGNPEDYPVANHAHKCGLYIGMHQNVTLDMVEKLAHDICKL